MSSTDRLTFQTPGRRPVQYYNYLVPSFSRKKRGFEQEKANTFRVLNGDSDEVRPTYEPLPLDPNVDHLSHYYPKHPANHSRAYVRDHRHRNSAASNLEVFHQNARTLNEPVTFVKTYGLEQRQNRWWPEDPSYKQIDPEAQQKDKKLEPVLNAYWSNREGDLSAQGGMPRSTMQDSYLQWNLAESANACNTRHTSNPTAFQNTGMKSAALGAVPVNNLWERGNGVRVYKERISMEHHFDCRDTKRDGYRPRGRREGALVWDRMDGQNSSVAACLRYHAPTLPLERSPDGRIPSFNTHQVAPGSADSPPVWTDPNVPVDVYGKPKSPGSSSAAAASAASLPPIARSVGEWAGVAPADERSGGVQSQTEPLVRQEECRVPSYDSVGTLIRPGVKPYTIP